MALSEPMALENLLKIIAGEMDPTSGHIHLEVGKTDVGFKPKPQHV
jgi:hypothetical protein